MSDITTAPTSDAVDEGPIILTESAAAKVRDLMSREENADQIALRVAVQPGGCSGMRYALFFDDRQLDGDKAAELKGVRVRVDKMSAPYLRGTEIDWVDSLQGAGFAINNPNA
jgi:iron-sulfur cluster assembly protein